MFHEFTVGVNYYSSGHAAKFTVDAVYLPDGTPDNETGIGVLAATSDAVRPPRPVPVAAVDPATRSCDFAQYFAARAAGIVARGLLLLRS